MLFFVLTFINLVVSVGFARNVLLRKPSTQSSCYDTTCNKYNASLAVDGDSNPNFDYTHCFHNTFEILEDRWILVDMLIAYKIDYVVFWSRDSDSERNEKFIIGLTNVNYFDPTSDRPLRGKFPICGQYPDPPQVSSPHRVNCGNNVTASRYVIAQQYSLALVGFVVCELEAFPREEKIWRHREGMKLSGLTIRTTKARTVYHCVILCLQSTGCSSVNFNRDSKTCDLNTGTVENVTNFVGNQSCDYWQRIKLDSKLIEQNYSVISQKNVLLLKPATQSSIYLENNAPHPGSLAVDGDKNPDIDLGGCFHAGVEPLKEFWVLVDMIIPYRIDYVILWSRKYSVYTPRNDNFIIGLTNVNYFNLLTNQTIRGKFPLCGVYPYPTQPSFGHRVNCSSNLPASRYVIAQQAENAEYGFCICELEAYPMKGKL
ncbi:hypothetical protein HELRODRAFT_193117 [Helobdella robusta]|uniref:Apple domain-containing protein n=1 Tax=Helobdella robusta TaxID=6412 RepID=T1FUN0_HELRO|nr:hypothetical protein HELRODRAFT_193117 [Helobdella robusta]ESN98176.1 hypothetical protein HELRODRAFT_193117 [Helobdella robusta]